MACWAAARSAASSSDSTGNGTRGIRWVMWIGRIGPVASGSSGSCPAGTPAGSGPTSSTSATITVTLSGPPPMSASSISVSATRSVSGPARVSAIASAETTPDSPSLQIRKRSPTEISLTTSIGSGSDPFSARSNRLRCGWWAASSSVMRPSSTRDWTNVSSCESWCSTPLRYR